MLTIENLTVSVEDTTIIKDLQLVVKPGEIHAIMGPNGAGKSTLAKFLAGHPDYICESGSIYFQDEDLLDLEVEQRANKGFFVGFQYPIEIPGVTNKEFLQAALTARLQAQGKQPIDDSAFLKRVEKIAIQLEMPKGFIDRFVNDGFSGGEKKKCEVLQMLLLQPSLAILDETDSGLDIDAMKVVAKGVKSLMNKDRGLILITHYQRLLDYIQPDFVHVMIDGSIERRENGDFAKILEERGYDWIKNANV